MKKSNRLFQSTYKSLSPEKGKDMGVSLDLVVRVIESGSDTNFAGKYRAILITLLQAFLIVKFFFSFYNIYQIRCINSLAGANKGRNFYTAIHFLVNDLFRLYPLTWVSV